MTDNTHKRSSVKKAPEGFYTAQEATQKLGLHNSTFRYYVRAGKIKRYVPPLRKEGFYRKTEINQLAFEIALFQDISKKETSKEE